MDLVENFRTLARYNRWQNASMTAAADTLTDADRRQDRGAFFGSIHATMNHLLWGDRVWMSRFAGWDRPSGGISGSTGLHADWDAFRAARAEADAGILAWAASLAPDDVAGDFTWTSPSAGATVSKPRALLIQHFFNHQTHHRGQIHAMLTAAGARPGATDLFLMPDTA